MRNWHLVSSQLQRKIDMKVLVIVGLIFGIGLHQADSRSIGINNDLPKVLQETMEQSMSCALKMGPKARNIPRVQGIEQFPEDNPALNELWGCIWVKKGIINEAGEVNADTLDTFLVDQFTIFQKSNSEVVALADQITESCKDRHGDNYGHTAVKIQNCINGYLEEKLSQL